MATPVEFIEYVCEQINGVGNIRYKKMFGEYMAYVNEKPVLLVCDSTVYVKKLEQLAEIMKDAQTGAPYTGAKEHYILDIEDRELSLRVVSILEKLTPIPQKKTETVKKQTAKNK